MESVSKQKASPSRIPFLSAAAENLPLQKGVLFLVVVFSLALIILSQRGFLTPELSVGSVVQKDIRSDRDVLVIDRQSTERKKTDILSAIEPVFDMDDDVPETLIARLDRAFSAAEDLVRRIRSDKARYGSTASPPPELLRKLRTDFESNLGLPLTDREFDTLIAAGFSRDVFTGLSKLLQSVYASSVMSRVDFQKAETTKGITVRNIKTQKEKEMRNLQPLLLVEDVESYLREKGPVFSGTQPGMKDWAYSIVSRLVQPNLTFNRNATEVKKQEALDQLRPVYFKINKNELILREGDRVTPQTMDKIEALYPALGGGASFQISFLAGLLAVIAVLIVALYHISRHFLQGIESSIRDLLFLGLASVLSILVVRIGIFIAEAVNYLVPLIPTDASYYAIPFAMGPLLVAVFLNRNMALLFSLFMSFLITFFFPDKMPMFLLAFLGSAVSVYHTAQADQRTVFYKSGLYAGLLNTAVILSISILAGHLAFLDLTIKLVGAFAGGLLSGVLVAGIASPLEALFRYTTNIKLLELSNLNQPLMQRMIVEAPGSYQHSIIVASLVEAAAEAVQANSLLAKVSAYYHDIGKLNKPLYYVENQLNWKNKHDSLSPKMSSLVIISHVKDGCDLARQFQLGRTITDIIRQHHGTSVVTFFYEKAQKDKDPSIRSIPETEFRYPGPKPQTKEAGLVMLGDIVEASSRVLTDPTPARIRNLVQTRIRQAFMDGQLDECELTLHDLNKIAEVYERTLNAIFHHRVVYVEHHPKDANGRREWNGNHDFKPSEKTRHRH